MQAIEFETTLHNGIVTLPPEQATQWEGQAVRVIVLNPADAPTLPESISPPPTSLLSQLRQIKISAPPDFSENVDAYLVDTDQVGADQVGADLNGEHNA